MELRLADWTISRVHLEPCFCPSLSPAYYISAHLNLRLVFPPHILNISYLYPGKAGNRTPKSHHLAKSESVTWYDQKYRCGNSFHLWLGLEPTAGDWRMDTCMVHTTVVGIIAPSIWDKKIGEASYSLKGCSLWFQGVERWMQVVVSSNLTTWVAELLTIYGYNQLKINTRFFCIHHTTTPKLVLILHLA